MLVDGDAIQSVAVTSRRRLRQRDKLRSETELSPSRDLVHGTVFLYSSPTAHLLAPLDNISRPIYFIIILEHGTAAALRRLRPSITVSFT